MSTFLQLCNKYRKITGITGANLTSTTGQTGMSEKITIFISDADEFIQTLHSDWKFLWTTATITTVAGTDEYSLSTLSITDLGQWDTDAFVVSPGTSSYNKLNELDFFDWQKSSYRYGVKSSGKPTMFVVKPDDSLVFINKPDAVYTIWADYYKKPTRLSASSDTSAIPTEFEACILAKAKMYHGEYYEDANLYNTGKSEFLVELAKLESKQLQGRKQMRMGAANPENFTIEVG